MIFSIFTAWTPNYAWVLFLPVTVYYASLDVLVGLLLAIEVLVFSGFSNVLISQIGYQQTFWYGVLLQIVGWGVQVGVGHNYFEGRKPAIMDSLFQSLVSPFFLVLEALFALGYRKDLAKEIDRRSQAKIAAWKASKSK
eukprot:TRINITY_DN1479_c0_g1_i2.p1 TRINITY_DN1479_c0_g1~~TRINITY_DN1479_c0_g1_i2.p1  ORF type:complete len:139 (+),score=38.81 TRINITY_DN1479_c0_g1_i2:297-713(+)